MSATLAILAAGMGSRYGGLKQVDSVGLNGEAIIDFTIYDALKAGVDRVVFIIRKEHHELFKENFGDKIAKFVKVDYAFQDINDLPDGLIVPSERTKPWGTTHALLACRDIIKDEPFIICNADDFYGRSAFEKVVSFFKESKDENEYAACAYKVENTLSDNGSVTRGMCEVKDGYLSNIKECYNIQKEGDDIIFEENETKLSWPKGVGVSMNFWGFKPSVFKKLEKIFESDIKEGIKTNPLKYEALLPNHIGELIKNDEAKVRVLVSNDVWFGVTYKEDKPKVMEEIAKLQSNGTYPVKLWEK